MADVYVTAPDGMTDDQVVDLQAALNEATLALVGPAHGIVVLLPGANPPEDSVPVEEDEPGAPEN